MNLINIQTNNIDFYIHLISLLYILISAFKSYHNKHLYLFKLYIYIIATFNLNNTLYVMVGHLKFPKSRHHVC